MSVCNRIRCPKCHEKLSYMYSAIKRHTDPSYCKYCIGNIEFTQKLHASPQDSDVTVELQNEGNVRDTSAEIADQLDSHEKDVDYEWNVENSS